MPGMSPNSTTTTQSLDVGRVRSAFPALALGAAHFDGPGGSQVPQRVAQAVAEAMVAGLANRGRVTVAEAMSDGVAPSMLGSVLKQAGLKERNT